MNSNSSFDFNEILNPSLETLLRKGAITLMNDPRTAMLAPTVCLGEIYVDDETPTACTDGRDSWYGREFCGALPFKQLLFVQLHEELHKLCMDLMLCADLFAIDAQIANISCDQANNNTIMALIESGLGDLLEMPSCAVYDKKFRGWSKQQIFHFLRTGQNKDGEDEGTPEPQPGKGGSGSGSGNEDGNGKPESVTIGGKSYTLKEMDSLDPAAAQSLSKEEQEQLKEEVQRSIQQAILMAGMKGQQLPRTIMEALAPVVDWYSVLVQFITLQARGSDELTYRRYDRRYLDLAPGNELFLPTTMNERADTGLFCMDASGSTYGELFDKFVAACRDALTIARPERVRIWHWDTEVQHDEMCTESEYLDGDLKELMSPRGGGGTCVSSVSDYIVSNGISADFCIVLTDGYIEDKPRWLPRVPTLWVVLGKADFVPPAGQMVKVK